MDGSHRDKSLKHPESTERKKAITLHDPGSSGLCIYIIGNNGNNNKMKKLVDLYACVLISEHSACTNPLFADSCYPLEYVSFLVDRELLCCTKLGSNKKNWDLHHCQNKNKKMHVMIVRKKKLNKHPWPTRRNIDH